MIKNKLPDISKRDLIDLVNKYKTDTKVGIKLGISVYKVSKLRQKHRIKARFFKKEALSSLISKKQFKLLQNKHKTDKNIAKVLGYSIISVYKFRKKHKIKPFKGRKRKLDIIIDWRKK